MSENYENIKAVTLQTNQQKSLLEETSTDIILQSLMVDDSNLKRILRGEIQETIDNLEEFIANAVASKLVDSVMANRILEQCKLIGVQLAKYQRLLPYAMLLSHLMRLSNINEAQAEAIKLRIAIMIGRDLLDTDEEELELADLNFYDALQLLCHNAVNDSVTGWKARIVTEQKKVIETRIEENRPRKRKWGIF